MKRTRQLALILATFTLALLLAACQAGGDGSHLDEIRDAGKIVVGTSADYPPFESVDENGNFVGFDIALIQEIGRRMDLEIEIQDMPFDSLIAAVQEEKLDLAISAFNYDEERDLSVDFTEPYYFAEDAVLVAEGFGGTIGSAEDLAGYVVGAQTGTTQDGWITENLIDTGTLSEDNYFRYERIDQAALDLKAGRIDAILMESVVARSLVADLGGLAVVYEGEVSSGPVNIVIPEGDAELAEALNDVLADLQEEGFIDELVIEYMQ
jgi:polar amino acid transport system substrate-binding protein